MASPTLAPSTTPTGHLPDPDDLVQAAMEWHFHPDTGSPFWLERASTLDFDPRTDIRTAADLTRFPNVVDELRDVPFETLIPRGYGEHPDIVGVYESGGTTGAPKRVVFFRDWLRQLLPWTMAILDAHGFPRDTNWLTMVPTGPHVIGEFAAEQARARGGIRLAIDMDPRWVKKLIASGRTEEAGAYAEHLVGQARHVLRSQDIGVLMATPAMLERLARHDDLVELINEKVRGIIWGGTHMDADTRHLFRTEVFPNVALCGNYGSTMILTGINERAGLTDDEPCVFDPFSPYVSFSVIDPSSGEPVPYGQRGQVVMNFVSRGMLLPNNLERDIATRIRPPAGQLGDSVADVAPLRSFSNTAVIEGVY